MTGDGHTPVPSASKRKRLTLMLVRAADGSAADPTDHPHLANDANSDQERSVHKTDSSWLRSVRESSRSPLNLPTKVSMMGLHRSSEAPDPGTADGPEAPADHLPGFRFFVGF